MARLTVHYNGMTRVIEFEGQKRLDDILISNGMRSPHPCGGMGRCGKCRVELKGAVSQPDKVEVRFGARLSCRAIILGDAEVTVLTDGAPKIETATSNAVLKSPMAGNYGAAVDIGTTTIAAKVFDLARGECIATGAVLNPQISVASDVIGRMDAAQNGRADELKDMVRQAVEDLLAGLTDKKIESAVVTGNTAMLYLYLGLDTTPLCRAPFNMPDPLGRVINIDGREVYFPPCMGAFVGADITSAVLSAGLCREDNTAMLCDIGTNGEMALWHGGKLFVTSTAAGPVFEGAGIECGCMGVDGAIDKVSAENGMLCISTIGQKEPVGICGSGVVDAVAAGLELGLIDKNGTLSDDLYFFGDVRLTQSDVRCVQLAKSAIISGIYTLAKRAGVIKVDKFCIAGGFGSHLNVESGAKIGLLPKDAVGKAEVLGNAALAGAAELLLDVGKRASAEWIAGNAEGINLGGDVMFNKFYMENMAFLAYK